MGWSSKLCIRPRGLIIQPKFIPVSVALTTYSSNVCIPSRWDVSPSQVNPALNSPVPITIYTRWREGLKEQCLAQENNIIITLDYLIQSSSALFIIRPPHLLHQVNNNRPFSEMATENSKRPKLKMYTNTRKNTFSLVTL